MPENQVTIARLEAAEKALAEAIVQRDELDACLSIVVEEARRREPFESAPEYNPDYQIEMDFTVAELRRFAAAILKARSK